MRVTSARSFRAHELGMDYAVRYSTKCWIECSLQFQEPECCDGSDEVPGVCPDVCKQVGDAYRERVRTERKLRKTVCDSYCEVILVLTRPGFKNSILLHSICLEGEEADRGRDLQSRAGDCGAREESCTSQRSIIQRRTSSAFQLTSVMQILQNAQSRSPRLR